MKQIRILFLTLFCAVLPATGVYAQGHLAYPVDLNVQIIPPYNVCIRDLAPVNRFRVTVLMRDMYHANYQFKIQMKVKDITGSSIVFSTLSDEFIATPGVSELLSASALLEGLFKESNIETGKRYARRCFPEGSYIFTFQVVDSKKKTPVSREFQTFVYLEQGDVPRLLFPQNRASLDPVSNEIINFNWQMPYYIGVPQEFTLNVYEIQGDNTPEFTVQSGQPLFTSTPTFLTTEQVPRTAGGFQEGHRYAWQVCLTDKNMRSYPNRGCSEVFSFTYRKRTEVAFPVTTPPAPEKKINTALPEIAITKTPEGDGETGVCWEGGNPEQYDGYIVEVRKNGDDTWVKTTVPDGDETCVTLSNLKTKTPYEVRVQGYKEGQEISYGKYSDTKNFQIDIPDPEDQSCGDPLPTISAEVKTGVQKGQLFSANGYKVIIDEITPGSDNAFSGTGYIEFPLLPIYSLKVEFTNIKINTDNQLLSGTVKTVSNESTALMLDLNRFLNKGYGGGADAPVEEPKVNNKYSTLEDANRNLEKIQEGEWVQVTGTDDTTQEMYVKSNGALQQIGTVVPGAGYYANNGSVNSTAQIIFKGVGNIAFDNDKDGYFREINRTKDTYEKLLLGNYIVPWVAMNPGRIEKLDTEKKGDANLAEKEYIIPLDGGNILKLLSDDTRVTISGAAANTTTEIFAIAKVNGGSTKEVVGKVKLANYAKKEKKVVLVPVRRDVSTINGHEIQSKLNNIYGRLGIHFTVTVADRFGDGEEYDFLQDGLQVLDKSFFGNETAEMKELRLAYYAENAGNIEKNAAYLFVIDIANIAGVQGDMPRGKSVGYIFDNSSNFNNGRLVAHELAHGLFTLEHVFNRIYGNLQEGSTNNLMDYCSDDFLAAWQWKIIDNHPFVWNFLEGDEDAMSKIITIIGKIDKIDNILCSIEVKTDSYFKIETGRIIKFTDEQINKITGIYINEKGYLSQLKGNEGQLYRPSFNFTIENNAITETKYTGKFICFDCINNLPEEEKKKKKIEITTVLGGKIYEGDLNDFYLLQLTQDKNFVECQPELSIITVNENFECTKKAITEDDCKLLDDIFSGPCSEKFIKELSSIISSIPRDNDGFVRENLREKLNIATECTLEKLSPENRKRLYDFLFVNSQVADPYSTSHKYLSYQFPHIGKDDNQDYLLLALLRTAKEEEQKWLITFLKNENKNRNTFITDPRKRIKTHLDALIKGIPDNQLVSCAIPALITIYNYIVRSGTKPIDDTFTVNIDGKTIVNRLADNPIMFYYENLAQTRNKFTVENIDVTCDGLEMTLNTDNILCVKQNGYFTINGEELPYNEEYNIHPWQPVKTIFAKDMTDIDPRFKIGSRMEVPAILLYAYYEIAQRDVNDQNIAIVTASATALLSGYGIAVAGKLTFATVFQGIVYAASIIDLALLVSEDTQDLSSQQRDNIKTFRTIYNWLSLAEGGINIYTSLSKVVKIPFNGLLLNSSSLSKLLVDLNVPSKTFKQIKVNGKTYRAATFWKKNPDLNEIKHYISADGKYYIKYDNTDGQMLLFDAKNKKALGFGVDQVGELKNATGEKFDIFIANLKTTAPKGEALSDGTQILYKGNLNVSFEPYKPQTDIRFDEIDIQDVILIYLNLKGLIEGQNEP